MASDAELIAASLAGDGEAFVGVIRRHEVAVGAALGSRTSYDRSFPDARPWLFGVAHNTLRRHWRSRTGSRG